ncbi:uncharacterized protein LOC135386031 [Ornithodoros turicata]|uniref:uncharacterized protein LOC135386031 n=1 Tax=Ornithodoros turicata TaxID=34597 RepID=UPI0031399515
MLLFLAVALPWIQGLLAKCFLGISHFISSRVASASEFDLSVERSPQHEAERREMHEAIEAEDEDCVRKCLDAVPELKLWLHPDKDKSARYRAVEKKVIRIHGLLVSRGCGLKDVKESSCYKHLSRLERAEIRRQRYYTRECEKSYVYYLMSKSRILTGCDDREGRLEKVFEQLCSDELNRDVLKVAGTALHLEIQFDYNNANVQGMTGCSNGSTLGLTAFEEQRIYVCGNTEEPEVQGTLMHELSHMALALVYRNEGKPYYPGDIERERKYKAILNGIKQRRESLHDLIEKAFFENEEEELVVRVPHILAQYGSDDGSRVLERDVPELREFFKDAVIPDMQEYVRDYVQNGIPSIDAACIKNENSRLKKSFDIDKFNVEFENQLENSVWKNSLLHVVTGSELRLLEIMVHNTVKSSNQPYLFFGAHQMDSRLGDVLLDYKCAYVLVTVYPNNEVRKIIKLLGVVSCVTKTKVILLVEESDKENVITQVQQDAFFAKRHEVHSLPEASFENITNRCKDEIFKKSRVELQGEYVSALPEAMNSHTFLHSVDATAFLKLCESRNLILGPRLHELEETVKKYYVERVCRRAVQIDLKECKLNNNNEAFALLGCPRDYVAKLVPRGYEAKHAEELNRFEKFVELHKSSDYEALLRKHSYQGKLVHLLRFDGACNMLLWTKSSGGLSHLPMTGNDEYTVKALLNGEEKVAVVSGVPGMGKSVLASQLCEGIKNQKRERWVLYVDLPQRMAAVKIASPSLRYLADLCQVQKDGLEFTLFEESLNNRSPFEVAVILDAFDEVNAKCRECVLDLVSFLAEKNVYKVYIFTRTVFKSQVQDALHTVSYELVSFSDEDQVEFLAKYKEKRDESVTRNATVSQQLQTLYANLKKTNKTILGTPLLLRMMAELMNGEISESEEYSSLLKRVGISDDRNMYTVHLYRMFVEYMYLVHRIHKRKEDIILRTVQEDDDTPLPFYSIHGLLAMMCIFPRNILEVLLNEDDLEQLDPEGSFIQGVAKNTLKEGFVLRLNDGVPEFTHKTFAEFFSAHYLLEKTKIRRNPSFRNEVVSLYGKEDYEGVMVLFDGLASASFPLHSAVMNNDVSYFEQRVIQREDMLNVDVLRRTPLHVAALHADRTTFENLPMDDGVIKGDLFHSTPFRYLELLSWWDTYRAYIGMLSDSRPCQLDLCLKKPVLGVKLDILCARCSEEAVRHFDDILRKCETIDEKESSLVRSIFTAVICDLQGVLDVHLTYVSPRERTDTLDKETRGKLESRKARSSRCSAGSPVIRDLDSVRERYGETVLFYATSEAVCKMLLPYCDVGIVDESGNTMLHISAENRNLETTQFHLKHSSADVKNKLLQTPLHFSRNPEVVKLLLPLCASVNVLDYMEETPLDKCVKQLSCEAAKLLLLRSQLGDECHTRLNTTFYLACHYGSHYHVTLFLPHTTAHTCDSAYISWSLRAWKRCSRKDPIIGIPTLDAARDLFPHSLIDSPKWCLSSPLCVWALEGEREVLQTLWPYLRHGDPEHALGISSAGVSVQNVVDNQQEILCLKFLLLHLNVIAGNRYGRKLLHEVVVKKLLVTRAADYISYMKVLLPHVYLSEQDYIRSVQREGAHDIKEEDVVTLYRRWSSNNNNDVSHSDDADTKTAEGDRRTQLLIGAAEGDVDAVKSHLTHSSV